MPRHPVTLRGLDPARVTVTRSALHVGISPIVFLAVLTRLPSETMATLALSSKLIAGGADSIVGVTATGITAIPAAQVPVVGHTVVTVLADDIGQTLALPTTAVTLTLITRAALTAVSAQEVTCAFPAVASGRVSIVTRMAEPAVRPLCIVEALLALPCASVTCVHVRDINVVVTLAGLTPATRLQGVTIETRGTLITTGTCVSLVAVTDDLPVSIVLVT